MGSTLHTLLLVAHVLIGAAIVGLVLIQRGKGAETGAAFGAGASGTVFGAKGSANFLSRSTAALATLFFATSLTLAYLGAQRPVLKSIVEQVGSGSVPATAPAVPDAGTAVGPGTAGSAGKSPGPTEPAKAPQGSGSPAAPQPGSPAP